MANTVCPLRHYFVCFYFSPNNAVSLLFHVVLATTEAFVISWDELSYPLFMSVRVLTPVGGNLPVCGLKDSASALETHHSRSATNSSDIMTTLGF